MFLDGAIQKLIVERFSPGGSYGTNPPDFNDKNVKHSGNVIDTYTKLSNGTILIIRLEGDDIGNGKVIHDFVFKIANPDLTATDGKYDKVKSTGASAMRTFSVVLGVMLDLMGSGTINAIAFGGAYPQLEQVYDTYLTSAQGKAFLNKYNLEAKILGSTNREFYIFKKGYLTDQDFEDA